VGRGRNEHLVEPRSLEDPLHGRAVEGHATGETQAPQARGVSQTASQLDQNLLGAPLKGPRQGQVTAAERLAEPARRTQGGPRPPAQNRTVAAVVGEEAQVEANLEPVSPDEAGHGRLERPVRRAVRRQTHDDPLVAVCAETEVLGHSGVEHAQGVRVERGGQAAQRPPLAHAAPGAPALAGRVDHQHRGLLPRGGPEGRGGVAQVVGQVAHGPA